MYHRSLYSIVTETGQAVLTLTREMQDEAELFASSLTLRAVEAQLLIMAHTLGNVTPLLHQKLMQVDWDGWAALHTKLRQGVQPRREEIWYAIQGLVPQTMQLLGDLKRRQPTLFEWGL
ncbi:MAG: hypothetical protein JNJ71_15545 [Rubrivivax sp.]|nr:hypothetical protein [Rubrivivax sp.]